MPTALADQSLTTATTPITLAFAPYTHLASNSCTHAVLPDSLASTTGVRPCLFRCATWPAPAPSSTFKQSRAPECRAIRQGVRPRSSVPSAMLRPVHSSSPLQSTAQRAHPAPGAPPTVPRSKVERRVSVLVQVLVQGGGQRACPTATALQGLLLLLLLPAQEQVQDEGAARPSGNQEGRQALPVHGPRLGTCLQLLVLCCTVTGERCCLEQ